MSFFRFVPVFFLTIVSSALYAQPYGDSLSVKAEATVQVSPPSITIDWPADNDATNFTIYRKNKGTISWGSPLATLPSNATSYTDLTVSINTLYDYKIYMSSVATPVKYGYLSSGIEVIANSDRGIAIVVIEDSYIGNATFQLALDEFLNDLELDGWYPKPIYVSATDAVTSVKSSIVTTYNVDATRTKLLVLIGNVPVPYSGNLNPDGHPDHQGAWPTDTYYADMTGTWTDVSVNNIISGNAANHNIPGDGKFDQDLIPSDLELQVGRIDLSNMPAFSETEEELLLRYFYKTHLHKSGTVLIGEQALIDDNFGGFAEGFSQSGYNNFAALVGRNNTYLGDYFTNLSYTTSTTGTYLWSYGCGGGSYTSCGGIGNTTNFTSDSLSSVFTMLFGSYFGDWNYTNAFLLAPLAQGNTLTNCWAGRPNWYFNHMAMGENIGYSARLTQNNGSMYIASIYGGMSRMITINLMGDPSLRNTYLPSPDNLVITAGGNSNSLAWTASGSEIGYNVYRRYADSTNFLKLNSSLITATNFVDNNLPVAGVAYYYVKAVELKVTPSGSFENESLAAKDSALSTVDLVTIKNSEILLYPNPANATINFNVPLDLIGNSFQIFDTKGTLVLSGNLKTENMMIDVSAFAKGTYTLSFSKSGVAPISFVKQ